MSSFFVHHFGASNRSLKQRNLPKNACSVQPCWPRTKNIYMQIPKTKHKNSSCFSQLFQQSLLQKTHMFNKKNAWKVPPHTQTLRVSFAASDPPVAHLPVLSQPTPRGPRGLRLRGRRRHLASATKSQKVSKKNSKMFFL